MCTMSASPMSTIRTLSTGKYTLSSSWSYAPLCPNENRVEASRIARGPKRAPERYWVPISYGTPSTATSASILSQSRQSGRFPNVHSPTNGRSSRPLSYPWLAIGNLLLNQLLACDDATCSVDGRHADTHRRLRKVSHTIWQLHELL